MYSQTSIFKHWELFCFPSVSRMRLPLGCWHLRLRFLWGRPSFFVCCFQATNLNAFVHGVVEKQGAALKLFDTLFFFCSHMLGDHFQFFFFRLLFLNEIFPIFSATQQDDHTPVRGLDYQPAASVHPLPLYRYFKSIFIIFLISRLLKKSLLSFSRLTLNLKSFIMEKTFSQNIKYQNLFSTGLFIGMMPCNKYWKLLALLFTLMLQRPTLWNVRRCPKRRW